jgi:fatty acid desaturase
MDLDEYPTVTSKVLRKMLSVFLLLKTIKYIQGTFFTFIYVKDTPIKEVALRIFFIFNIVLWISFFHQWVNFALIWLIPFLSVFQIIRFFAEVSEHGGLYKSEDQVEMTRNNLIHPIIRFFLYPHGDAYHLTHHLMPGIPHYHLPVAHHFLMTDEQYQKAHHCFGYFFKPAAGAMSTFSELVLKGSGSH